MLLLKALVKIGELGRKETGVKTTRFEKVPWIMMRHIASGVQVSTSSSQTVPTRGLIFFIIRPYGYS
jgi:hypothetical protein